MKTRIIVGLLFIALFVYAGSASAVTEGSSNNYFGTGAGGASGSDNSFFGANAGNLNTGDSNSFFGLNAGYDNTGNLNTFVGFEAGSYNATGSYNTFVGTYTGTGNVSGSDNVFIGGDIGAVGLLQLGDDANTIIGTRAGFNVEGSNNTFIGYESGRENVGDLNVFLGYHAGYYELGSNRLYISNSSNNAPLIYGEFDNKFVKINGTLEVGIAPAILGLEVIGTMKADKFEGDGALLINVPFSSHTHLGSEITSIVAEAQIDPLIARGSEVTSAVNAHATLTNNPHEISTSQIGAANASHTHSGEEITATVGESTIESTIARDSEIMPTLLANDGSESGVDADLLDGQDSTSFMSASTDNWVNTTGDTMNGDLLVNGIVDIDQHLYVVGNIYAESDVNSKKDIKPIESSLDKILSIQGVSYIWKDNKRKDQKDPDSRHYGVIAQQVEEVIPEIVKEGQNNKKKVAYMELIPVLIEAVKEQQQTISGLSEKINELERELKLRGSMAMVATDYK